MVFKGVDEPSASRAHKGNYDNRNPNLREGGSHLVEFTKRRHHLRLQEPRAENLRVRLRSCLLRSNCLINPKNNVKQSEHQHLNQGINVSTAYILHFNPNWELRTSVAELRPALMPASIGNSGGS